MRRELVQLTEEEYEELKRVSLEDSRDHLLIRVMAELGLRSFEAAKLDVRDINRRYPQSVTVVGKGNVERSIPINDSLYPLLLAYVGDRKEGLVFHKKKDKKPGTPMSTRNIRYIVRYYGRRIGKPELRPHALRYYFSVRLSMVNIWELGIPYDMFLVAKKELMGHAKTLTEHYTPAPWEIKVKLVKAAFGGD